jgi:hypothetical protein
LIVLLIQKVPLAGQGSQSGKLSIAWVPPNHRWVRFLVLKVLQWVRILLPKYQGVQETIRSRVILGRVMKDGGVRWGFEHGTCLCVEVLAHSYKLSWLLDYRHGFGSLSWLRLAYKVVYIRLVSILLNENLISNVINLRSSSLGRLLWCKLHLVF